MTITILPTQKLCQRCGQGFDCGGLFGCWCWKVKLDATTRAGLREQFTDCLCRACLRAVADESASQMSVSDKTLTG